MASTKTNQASATYYVGVLIKNNTYVYTTSGKTPELILTIKDEKGNNVTAGVNGLTYVTSGGVSGFDVTGKRVYLILKQIIQYLRHHQVLEQLILGHLL